MKFDEKPCVYLGPHWWNHHLETGPYCAYCGGNHDH